MATGNCALSEAPGRSPE